MAEDAMPVNPASALRELIGQKEKELQEMNELRIQALESTITERDRQIADLKENFRKLKVDFQYNLKLIEDRDAELERYDSAFVNLKNMVRDRDAEISDLKVAADEMESQLRAEREQSRQLADHHQENILEMKEKLESVRRSKDEEIRKLRNSMDEMRRDFVRQLSEKDDVLEVQRRDMSVSFDDLMRRFEHEGKSREDDLHAEIRKLQKNNQDLSTKITELENLLEEARRSNESLNKLSSEKGESLKRMESEIFALQRDKSDRSNEHARALRELNAKYESIIEEKEDKIAELQRMIQTSQSEAEGKQEDFEIKLRRALEDQEKTLRGQVREAEKKIETLNEELVVITAERDKKHESAMKAQRDLQEMELAHLEAIQGLERKYENAESSRMEAERNLTSQKSLLEEEITGLREKVSSLKRLLEERRQDLDKMREELNEACKREADLKKQLVQREFDMERLSQESEDQANVHFAELLRNMTNQRDQAMLMREEAQDKLTDVTRQLQQAQAKIHSLTELRDRRPANLTIDRGDLDTPLDSPIQMPPFPDTPSLPPYLGGSRPTTADSEAIRPGTLDFDGRRPTTGDSEMSRASSRDVIGGDGRRVRTRIHELEDQNLRLREVISQMRSEIENISGGEQIEKANFSSRLRKTENALKRVTAERDKLIQISNMLRADLKRQQLDDARPHSQWDPLFPSMRHADSSLEGQDEEDEEGDAWESIEKSMKLLVKKNTNLKERLTTEMEARNERERMSHSADPNLRMRRKVEQVRESLALAGQGTDVLERPPVLANSLRATESQQRAFTRVAMQASKKKPIRVVFDRDG